MLIAFFKHTLDCYSCFPEHIRVFQQLCLVSVDSNDLTASVEDSTIAQAEVTHSACKHNTQVSNKFISARDSHDGVLNYFYNIKLHLWDS